MNEENNTMQETRKNSLGIPIAIVIAGAIVAGAIYFSGSGAPTQQANTQGTNTGEQVTPETEIAPVTENDHIRGNPNAPIVIVEYSDFDCPFCKNFHETMNQVMAEYGADGKVAWVYRHFPLIQLHPNAPALAAASECVAELGGNDAFWNFTDLIFGERGVNEATDVSRLTEFAQTAGVDGGQFDLCHNSGKYDDAIDTDLAAALKTGARGTPYSVVLVGDQQGVINGAQQYPVVKQILDDLLAQIEGRAVSQ
jgi:protein-disulfide isomerase